MHCEGEDAMGANSAAMKDPAWPGIAGGKAILVVTGGAA